MSHHCGGSVTPSGSPDISPRGFSKTGLSRNLPEKHLVEQSLLRPLLQSKPCIPMNQGPEP